MDALTPSADKRSRADVGGRHDSDGNSRYSCTAIASHVAPSRPGSYRTGRQSNLAKAASNPWGKSGPPSNTMFLATPGDFCRCVQRFLQGTTAWQTYRHTTLREHLFAIGRIGQCKRLNQAIITLGLFLHQSLLLKCGFSSSEKTR